ncbi:MAG: hypothetical protein AAFO72_00620 [Pseudomonadota bacterium]
MLDESNTTQTEERSPLDSVADHARRVSQMCDLLEALADDLPHRPAPVWREATRLCNDIIPGHYKEVLDVLVPILQRRTEGEVECEDLLRRLQADFEDEACRLSELNDLLVEAVETDAGRDTDAKKIASETLGYALRGFFAALRRNGSWETDVLLPLAARRLIAEDLAEMAVRLHLHYKEKLN